MPTRMLREGIVDSRRMARLSDSAKVLYYKLFSVADDFGRFEADPEFLRRKLFIWECDRITCPVMEALLEECASGDDPLIVLYTAGNKKLLEIQNFNQQQRSKSKYPPPMKFILHADACSGMQMHTDHSVPTRTDSSNKSKEELSTNTGGVLLAFPSPTPPVTSSPPQPAAPSPPTPVGEAQKRGVDPKFELWAEAKYQAHPKKKDKYLAMKVLVDVFAGHPDRQAAMDRYHPLWCKTVQWTKDNGMYCPKMHEFVWDDGYLSPPPGFVEESAPPVRTRTRDQLA